MSTSLLATTRALPTTSKHDDFFYFQDYVFQAEDTLFNVPRYGPTMDAAFDGLFNSPGGSLVAGTSDEEPVVLADVTADEFRLLLNMMFPAHGVGSTFNTSCFGVNEWTSVLRVSTVLGLSSIRTAAISQFKSKFDQLPTVEKILLAERFGIDEWLNEAYDALIGRQAGITHEERERLGWKTYGRLMELREQCWVTKSPTREISATLARGKGSNVTKMDKKKKKKKSGM